MIYAVDTHALYWYLKGSRHLSRRARAIFTHAEYEQHFIYIPIMVVAELQLLLEKTDDPQTLDEILEPIRRKRAFEIVPLEPEHVMMLPQLRRIPEMHDRLIVATALSKDVALVTTDESIEKSGLVETIW